MKILISISSAIAVGIASCSGSPPSDPTAQKPKVVASSSILCDLTDQIAHDTVALQCLMSANQDPHTYSVIPSNRQAIEEAQLVLYDGYKFAPSLEKLVNTSIESPKVAVYEEAVPNPLMGHHHGEEVEPDPHVWYDVQNTIKSVEVIKNHLAQVNPTEADFYTDSAQQFEAQLVKLDSWIKEQIATIPPSQRTLVTTHDAFKYYAQAYGLNSSEALQGLSTAEQPTATQVKELVNKVKSAKVPTIFAEVAGNDRVITTVAREADINVSQQELLAGGLGEGSQADTYIGMMTSNTCTIVEGLGGQCQPFSE